MIQFARLDKKTHALLKDINKIYKESHYYTTEASRIFANKYFGEDPSIPDNVSEATQKRLALLARLGYIEDEYTPVPTWFGMKYSFYKWAYYFDRYLLPAGISLIVSLTVNLILNYQGVQRILDALYTAITASR